MAYCCNGRRILAHNLVTGLVPKTCSNVCPITDTFLAHLALTSAVACHILIPRVDVDLLTAHEALRTYLLCVL